MSATSAWGQGPLGSPTRQITVVKSDTVDFANGFIANCLNVTVSGLYVVLATQDSIKYGGKNADTPQAVYIAAGVQFPIECCRVYATGSAGGTVVAGSSS